MLLHPMSIHHILDPLVRLLLHKVYHQTKYHPDQEMIHNQKESNEACSTK